MPTSQSAHGKENTYSTMLAAVRSWIAAEHPEAEYSTLIVSTGNDVPATRIVFTSSAKPSRGTPLEAEESTFHVGPTAP